MEDIAKIDMEELMCWMDEMRVYASKTVQDKGKLVRARFNVQISGGYFTVTVNDRILYEGSNAVDAAKVYDKLRRRNA